MANFPADPGGGGQLYLIPYTDLSEQTGGRTNLCGPRPLAAANGGLTSGGGGAGRYARRWRIWKWLMKRLDLSLVKTAELDPKQAYIIGIHPHGYRTVTRLLARAGGGHRGLNSRWCV